MKKTLILVAASSLLFMAGNVSAQLVTPPIDESTNLISYKAVVEAKGTKDQLYVKAIAWINATYANPSDVTKVRSPEEGKIVAKHRFKLFEPKDDGTLSDISAGLVDYSLTIELKEGKFRYILTEFVWKQTSKYPAERWMDKTAAGYVPKYENYLNQIDVFAKDLIKKMTETIQKQEVKKDDSNW